MKFFKSINFRSNIIFYMISWFLIPISNNMYCQDLNDVFKIDNENLEQKQTLIRRLIRRHYLELNQWRYQLVEAH